MKPIEKTLSEELTYENRIVVFIDILGFSNIVKSTVSTKKAESYTKKANKVLANLRSALQFIHKHFYELRADYDNSSIQLSQFSDSIVISVLENSEELILIFKHLKLVQTRLLNKFDILIRGGVVKGLLIHTDNLLLGPAMVNAYNLESKCAISPRIVVDPKVKWSYDKINKNDAGETIEKEKILKKDYDGTFYIDYFNYNLDFYSGENEEEYFRTICKKVKENVESSDISIRMKYLWMREKLKRCLNYKKYEYIYKEINVAKKS